MAGVGPKSCEGSILRVQDKGGRGPWRPGFSHIWTNPDRAGLPQAIWEVWPDLKFNSNVLHYGCGCRSKEQLAKWFDAYELSNLYMLGFRLVSIKPDRILAENEDQVVFGVRQPLAECGKPFSEREMAA